MIHDFRVVVVMPAYNAEHTIEKTWREVIAQGVVDLVLVVEDASKDDTIGKAQELDNVVIHRHPKNRGYGADFVVMVHPDYQYTPKLIPAPAGLVASGLYPCVLASRILGGGALRGGMPRWRYVANRGLTLVSNWMLGTKLSEFHTGYRAYSRELLEQLPLEHNSDDFVFDSELIAQTVWLGAQIGEVSCPTRYAPDASSINFRSSVRYGFGCLATALVFRLARWNLLKSPRFPRC